MVGATTRLRCTTRSSEGWTVADVCRFVEGLSQEFGDQASVYAAVMKEQAIDGKTLLDLSSVNPIADNKLKELGVKIGHRVKLKSCIQGLQLASQVPPSSRASLETPASRCTAPSAHPPQVMLRIRPSPSKNVQVGPTIKSKPCSGIMQCSSPSYCGCRVGNTRT